ncbi:MAG: ABC transporter ATP-binding protein [Chloroflexota bacterium]
MTGVSLTLNQGNHIAPALIELRNLHKIYRTPAGEVPALRGIDLQVSPGEFVAVLGKSGAGKSTLINMITGIDRPDAGEIVIGGTPIQTLNEDQRSRWRGLNLGIVFQFFQLLPSVNIIKNVTIPMDFCGRYTRRQRRERALHLLEQVGIAEHAHKTPSEISGGQQQRVAIARALANDPPVIVADEPTGNLDSRTAGEILDLFVGLVEHGKTLLIVTHDKSIAARASRRVKIVDGLIAA